MKPFALMAMLFLAAGLGSCTQAPTEVPMTGFYSELKTCRARYAEFDARIDAAGVRDAAFYRIPGFPYLRTDRMLASFRNEVQTVDEVGGWVRRLRESDQEAREFELENLGLSRQDVAILRFEFLNCGRGLAGLELDDPNNLALLRKAAQPPDDYSTLDRTLGLYPLTRPLLRSRIEQTQEQLRSAFAQPPAQTLGGAAPLLWQVEPAEDLSLIPASLNDTYPDELGMPGLVDSAWRAIAEANAPSLLTVADPAARQLGTPVWSDHGIDVDTAHPLVNYQIGFVRFGQRALIQVAYFFWFKVPPAELTSPGQAPIDGMVWRVTLGRDMKPLAYESVRTSGREHFWFQAGAALKPRAGDADGQAAFFPQQAPIASRPLVVLETASGGVRHVVEPTAVAAAESRQYPLRRYEDLYRLPRPGGGSRSLFAPDGRIAGSDSPAAGWMLASGVAGPGVLRHLAHMPLDYIGERHFDDPFMLDSAFLPMPIEQRAQSPAEPGETRQASALR